VYAIIYASGFGIATLVSPVGKYGLYTPHGALIPFRKVAVPFARKFVFPIILFPSFTLFFLPYDINAQHGLPQVPAAHLVPEVERPPVPPAGSSDLPNAAVLLPAGQAAQVVIPPQGKPTLPGLPPPSDEEPKA
jgi:hypothetical protein